MGNLPSVDVCVLVKNEVESIGKCIDSLLANGYPNFRILICDGRSTDGTLEVIQGYARKHTNVVLHIQKSSGCGAARQELMQFVEADYTAWTDGGSVVDKNWLRELIVPLLNSDEKVAGSGGFNYVVSNGSVLGQFLGLSSVGVRFKDIAPGFASSLVGNNVCYKTEILRKNPWATFLPYGDDFEMALRLGRKGYKFIAAPNAKAYIRTQEKFKGFLHWMKRKVKGEIILYARCEDTMIDLKTFTNKLKMALLKRLMALTLSILLLMLIILTPYKIPLTITLSGLTVSYMIYLFKRRFHKEQLGEKIFKRTYLLFPLIDFLFVSSYAFYAWRYSKSLGA